MRKRLLSIITLLLVSTLLFAAGAKEVASDETVVKVLRDIGKAHNSCQQKKMLYS